MNRKSHITLVDGIETSALTIADRGLAYGDGLFETMRVTASKIPLLKLHLARFERGVLRLKLGSPKTLRRQFKKNIDQVLAQISDSGLSGNALVKVMITRGCGGVGYAPPKQAECSFISQVFNLPEYPSAYGIDGISVKTIDHRLPIHPALAGIKHLNRLDQVIASQELEGEQEGLMFDQNNCLIEGIKSNVLVFEGNKVITPALEQCGVKGTLRQYLINHGKSMGLEICEAEIDQTRLASADGLAMINSIFGVWPVSSVCDINGKIKQYASHPSCKIIQHYISKQLRY